MAGDELSREERQILLRLARNTIETAARNKPRDPLEIDQLPARLCQPGATFVTLTKREELRGCVGALDAYQSIAEDVQEHAFAAAFRDFRFSKVEASELPELHIEISVICPSLPLKYDHPEELLVKLRPNIDGVILRDGGRKATFLPQVWQQLPDPAEFLCHLCRKMGVDPYLWRKKNLQVFTYRVEMFEE